MSPLLPRRLVHLPRAPLGPARWFLAPRAQLPWGVPHCRGHSGAAHAMGRILVSWVTSITGSRAHSSFAMGHLLYKCVLTSAYHQGHHQADSQPHHQLHLRRASHRD